jgi:hypothetical protein
MNSVTPATLDRGPQTQDRESLSKTLDDWSWTKQLLSSKERIPRCSWSKQTKSLKNICKSSKCLSCMVRKAFWRSQQAQDVLMRANRASIPCQWITLTSPGGPKPMHHQVFASKWGSFQRRTTWSGFMWVLGADDDSGRLHRHVIAVNSSISPAELRARVFSVGLGEQCDVEDIEPTLRSSISVANYYAYNGVRYRFLQPHTTTNIRPFGTSMNI